MAGLVDRLWKFVRALVPVIGPYLPCTGMNTVRRSFDKRGRDVLDVGGGWGNTMRGIRNKRNLRLRVNADIYLPHLEQARTRKTHDEYILCDARNLPFKEKSFDIVLCIETIEHLEKEEGLKLLIDLEKIARQQVIVETPVKERLGPSQQKDVLLPGHLSSWHPDEFRKRGYKIRGAYLPTTIGGILTQSSNKLLSLLGYFLFVVVSPFVYFFPNKAGDMTCVKSLANEAIAFKESQ
jgi:hypothetical protein